MSINDRPLQRRDFLRGSLAAAALIPGSAFLASCATSGTGTTPPGGGAVLDRRHQRHQPVRDGGQLRRRRGHLQRRLRHRVRRIRGQAGREGPGRLDGQGQPGHQHRPDAAAAFRRRQPAGRDRQQRRRAHRDQHHPGPAGRPDRRDRGQELRGRGHQGHPVRRGHRAGHVRRQVRPAQLRAHRLRAVVFRGTVRGERLDRAEDLRGDVRARRRGQEPRASTCSAGARKRPPTTRRWRSVRRSSRVATRSGWRWRTSSRTAGRCSRCRTSSPG